MRWEGQQATDAGALLPLRGLIRSVRTPEFAGVTFHEVLCKSALNKVPGRSQMPFTWTINTTRGCLHRCTYCFARKTHEYLDLDSGADFDSQIVVKTNVVEVLRAELAKPSWCREHVALGTNSDPYMRAEGRYRLMPGVIGALADSRTPFSILTKGPLLRRDLGRIAAAVERVDVGIGISLAFTDVDLQQRVEPGTPTPKVRLDLIRAVAEAGLRPAVMAIPILPWLTDSDRHLNELFGAIKEAGGTWVSAGPLHLRPGAREWFMAWLAQAYPALMPRYRTLFGRGSYTSTEYRQWLGERVRVLRSRHGFVREADDGGARWTLRTDPDAVGDPAASVQQLDPRPAHPALF